MPEMLQTEDEAADVAVQTLASEWQSSGLEPGDMVLVHSSLPRSLRRLKKMGVRPDPALILRSLRLAIGEEGTLLLPTFNFDFTKGQPFDVYSTPSQMGTLTEIGRAERGSRRSGHPIYSFAAIGRDSHKLDRLLNFSGYGSDSPFGILHRSGGKIAIIDLPDQNSMTFYHYVEESREVSYRYHKEFSGYFTDWDGATSFRTFGLFVRDLAAHILTDVDPMGELLWKQGLYRGARPNSSNGMRVIQARSLFDSVADVIDSGRAEGLLFRYGTDE